LELPQGRWKPRIKGERPQRQGLRAYFKETVSDTGIYLMVVYLNMVPDSDWRVMGSRRALPNGNLFEINAARRHVNVHETF
jgi:hypothetical protein